MKWYARKIVTAAAKPPAYAVERISDLVHVAEISQTAPGEARKMLGGVIAQLGTHDDSEFASRLLMAENRFLDNPELARQIIAEVISKIEASVKRHDKEKKEKTWLTRT